MAEQNRTNEIDHTLIPDNTVTIIVKANGKAYGYGAEIGVITPDISDEDLNSTLRAINGLGITTQKTIAQQIAGRDDAYVVPGNDPEQDLSGLVEAIADVEVEKASATEETTDADSVKED